MVLRNTCRVFSKGKCHRRHDLDKSSSNSHSQRQVGILIVNPLFGEPANRLKSITANDKRGSAPPTPLGARCEIINELIRTHCVSRHYLVQLPGIRKDKRLSSNK